MRALSTYHRKPSRAVPLIRELRDARLAKGLSQEEVGYRIGVRQDQISGWEVGRTAPTLRLLVNWCAALDMKLTLADK